MKSISAFLSARSKKNSQKHQKTFKSANSPSSLDYYPSRLPVELWFQVVSYIGDSKDLRRLLFVSREFRAVIEPQLYRVIEVDTPDDDTSYKLKTLQILALFRSIKTPWLAAYVVVLRIGLDRIKHCRQSCRICNEGTSLKAVHPSLMEDCRCEALDRKLGNILDKLPNLRTLSFWCRFRHPERGLKHTWITKLRLQALHELEFSCPTQHWQEKEYKRLLLSPCMSNIEALHLDVGDYSEALRSLFIETPDAPLPNINTIIFNNSSVLNQVISRRPIKKLVCLSTPAASDLTRAGRESLLRLQLLYVQDARRWLTTVEDRSPYSNLVYLGSVRMRSSVSEAEALGILREFSFLKHLKSIEVAFDSRIPSTWSSEFFTSLEALYQRLIRIYMAIRISGRTGAASQAVIYRKLGIGNWQQRIPSYLTYWQIATGMSYEDLHSTLMFYTEGYH
ncbi:hypothetical protein FRC14_008015 [Serendipita sp. 396]|nr:hypothetical protein FRC14_008015 [Serendipita sp. 396]KAG8801662.1 hypothetical protein FRC16_011367 [Serendipita sp. 398]KAG8828201.1 hypothetical protein FRC18_009786 [Serendipita sp. 400]